MLQSSSAGTVTEGFVRALESGVRGVPPGLALIEVAASPVYFLTSMRIPLVHVVMIAGILAVPPVSALSHYARRRDARDTRRLQRSDRLMVEIEKFEAGRIHLGRRNQRQGRTQGSPS